MPTLGHKKLGRKKKEILEHNDLDDFYKFQDLIKGNAKKIGQDNLSQKEKEFLDEFVVNDTDSVFIKTQKMYKFKHYILKKTLTQDECTYLVNVNDKGLKPSEKKKLCKMRICTLEAGALMKLKKALGDKFNITSLKEFMFTGDDRRMPAKPINSKET